MIDRTEDLLGGTAEIDAGAQFSGPAIVKRAVSVEIDAWILRERQQMRGLFEVEFLAIIQAKREEILIAVLASAMLDQFAAAPAHHRITTQHVRTQPIPEQRAIEQKLLAHHVVNGRIVIAEQADQGIALAFAEHRRVAAGDEGPHNSYDK